MTFEGQYLTYEEYKFLGGTLELPSFNLLEFYARNQIDLMTCNRLVNKEDIPQKVKICDFNLIERIKSYNETFNDISEQGNLASFNSDGYSESYISPTQISEIVNSKQKEFEDIILNSLYGVLVDGKHLIYWGV